MTPSKALFWFCISFVAGIGLASSFGIAEDKMIEIPQLFLWGFLFLAILVIFLPFVIRVNSSIIRENSLIFGFCFLFLVLGILRFQIAEFNIENDMLRKLKIRPEKITLVGQIVDEPDVRDKFQKLRVKVDETNSLILVTAARYPEYNYLDNVKITGNLKTPMVT